jgi:hypothetical protein
LAASPEGEGPIPPELAEKLQDLADLLIEWVRTPDWAESRAYLQEHGSELLSDEAEMALQLLIRGNPGAKELPEHMALLKACREKGIDAAYEAFLAG